MLTSLETTKDLETYPVYRRPTNVPRSQYSPRPHLIPFNAMNDVKLEDEFYEDLREQDRQSIEEACPAGDFDSYVSNVAKVENFLTSLTSQIVVISTNRDEEGEFNATYQIIPNIKLTPVQIQTNVKNGIKKILGTSRHFSVSLESDFKRLKVHIETEALAIFRIPWNTYLRDPRVLTLFGCFIFFMTVMYCY